MAVIRIFALIRPSPTAITSPTPGSQQKKAKIAPLL